jgi:hypothetical protein
LFIAPLSQELEPLQIPGRFSSGIHAPIVTAAGAC